MADQSSGQPNPAPAAPATPAEADFSQIKDQQLETDDKAPNVSLELDNSELPEDLRSEADEDLDLHIELPQAVSGEVAPAAAASKDRPIQTQEQIRAEFGLKEPTVPKQPLTQTVQDQAARSIPETKVANLNGPMPEELKKWNWGAFFLSWIWAIANHSWVGLLALLGPVWIIMIFILGAKGNEWAWKNRKFDNVDQFKKVQSGWAKWGLGLFVIQVILVALLTSAVFKAYQNNQTTTVDDNTVIYQGSNL